jgi:hypothetical protein
MDSNVVFKLSYRLKVIIIKMLEEQRSKFQKYLRLIFKDLCAKDNGFTLKYFTLPTFLRVRHTSPFMPKSPLSF